MVDTISMVTGSCFRNVTSTLYALDPVYIPWTCPDHLVPDLRTNVPVMAYGTAIVARVVLTRATMVVWGGTVTGALNEQPLVFVSEPDHVYVLDTSAETSICPSARIGIPHFKLVFTPTLTPSVSDQPTVSDQLRLPPIVLVCGVSPGL